MPYKTGLWGEQAKLRSRNRLQYFKDRQKTGLRNLLHLSSYGVALSGEKIALKVLKNSVWHGEKYDIDWNGYKVDVKSSNIHRDSRHRTGKWDWTIDQKNFVDYFIFIAFDAGKLIKIFLVPSEKVNSKSVVALSPRSSRLDIYLLT